MLSKLLIAFTLSLLVLVLDNHVLRCELLLGLRHLVAVVEAEPKTPGYASRMACTRATLRIMVAGLLSHMALCWSYSARLTSALLGCERPLS